MISWSATSSMLRHFNTGVIKLPLGGLFADFRIDAVNIKDDTLVIHMLEKNHILLDENAPVKRFIKDGSQANRCPDLE